MFHLQLLQTGFADVAVNIDHEDIGRVPCGDADIRVRPSVPPGFDSLAISGGVLDTVGRARMLTWMFTISTGSASTMSISDCVQRDDMQTAPRVFKGLRFAKDPSFFLQYHPEN